MGGWMTYQRVRNRNGIMARKPANDPDPYWRQPGPPSSSTGVNPFGLVGDLNRMERDYLAPAEPVGLTAMRGPSPSEQCAKALGIDVETVQRVLQFVFMEQS